MKNRLLFPLLFGVATGLFVWSSQELLLHFVYTIISLSTIEVACFGLVAGGLLGVCIGGMDGFFSGSDYKLKRGFLFGGILGLLGGMASFYISDQLVAHVDAISSSAVWPDLLYILRWVILSISVGIGIGIRDRNQTVMIRGIVCGAFAGFIGGVVFTYSHLVLDYPFWVRGLGFIVMSASFSGLLYYSAPFGRKVWLRSLNGSLEGENIELTQDIHHFGIQDNDDINLSQYQDIQQSHAKLIKYFSNYSLVDNDPFCQTFVNFRGIKEQFLKNGDIIKVGTALFQYCSKE